MARPPTTRMNKIGDRRMFAPLPRLILAALLSASFAAQAAEKVAVTASHDLEAERPSETIAIPWADVSRALPGALIQKIAVKDSAGRVLAHQVTNVAPLAKDPTGAGVAYGELLFQYNFA